VVLKCPWADESGRWRLTEMILYINSCVRGDSRTDRLARHLLSRLAEPFREVQLKDIDFPRTDEDFLKWRDSCIASGDYSAEIFKLAKDFAAADTILISAPYWDLSFPAALKQYFEHINVLGLTFRYSPQGVPEGLCRAKDLYYVTTAGGPVFSTDFGFGYVKAMAEGYYGIKSCRMILAEGLDIDGADVEALLRAAEEEIDSI